MVVERSRRPTPTDRVVAEALSLPAEDRVDLVETLLRSLNLPTQAAIDRAWAHEAERRVAQIERGEVKLVPAEQVFRRIRRKHGR